MLFKGRGHGHRMLWPTGAFQPPYQMWALLPCGKRPSLSLRYRSQSKLICRRLFVHFSSRPTARALKTRKKYRAQEQNNCDNYEQFDQSECPAISRRPESSHHYRTHGHLSVDTAEIRPGSGSSTADGSPYNRDRMACR